MPVQTFKVGDRVTCTGTFDSPYLKKGSFKDATGTIIKQGDEWADGTWIVKFDEPQFALDDKEGINSGLYSTFELMEEELEKVGENNG